MGIPFMPVHGIHGTDYEKIRKDFRKISDPYSEKDIFVVPAIKPDVCLIHALKADRWGNLIISGSEANRLAALAAERTIATVERIVPEEEFKAKRGETFLSSLHVDLVVEAPLGAHPTSCSGYYPLDREHVAEYLSSAKDPDKLKGYIEKYIFSMKEDEYREKFAARFIENAVR